MHRYWLVPARTTDRVDLKGVLAACAVVAGIVLFAGGRGERAYQAATPAPVAAASKTGEERTVAEETIRSRRGAMPAAPRVTVAPRLSSDVSAPSSGH